jgi:Protein of unknown function (DUF4232)
MRRPLLIGFLTALTFVVAVSGSNGAGLQRCHRDQLRAQLGQANGAAGSVRISATFTNTSKSTCTLEGYPGMQMLNEAGKQIPTTVHRGLSGTVTQVRTVSLAPGAAARFYMGFADATGYSGKKCPASARVKVTAPNDFSSITVAWHLQPYGGTIPHLHCGLISVSPVQAGT